MNEEQENSEIFKFEDDFSNSEVNNEEPLFTSEDLNELLKDAEELKAKDIYSKINNLKENVQKNVIKPEEYEKNITDYELQSVLNYSDEKRKQDFYSPLDISQEKHHNLESEFKDFLSIPKISGKEKITTESKVLPNEIVENIEKKVEIVDYDDKDSIHHTSVEIGRDGNGDLEYIVIHCKCGEKTMIKFDYDDGNDNLTEVVKINDTLSPLNLEQVDLKKKD